jgi:hypothetical protein
VGYKSPWSQTHIICPQKSPKFQYFDICLQHSVKYKQKLSCN